jgi:hypothetical protein
MGSLWIINLEFLTKLIAKLRNFSFRGYKMVVSNYEIISKHYFRIKRIRNYEINEYAKICWWLCYILIK